MNKFTVEEVIQTRSLTIDGVHVELACDGAKRVLVSNHKRKMMQLCNKLENAVKLANKELRLNRKEMR